MAVTPQQRRLAAFLRAHPNAGDTHTLADIAREIGTTRAFVQAHLPGHTKERKARRQDREVTALRALLKANPNALRHRDHGGLRTKDMAAILNMSSEQVERLLRSLGLKRIRVPEEAQADKRRDSQRQRLQRVLRTEVCEVCGKTFPWTGQKEKRRRVLGAPITCARTCSRAAFKRRTART